MSATLYACYSHPEDPEAFDRHYRDTHAALGLAFPGLRSFTTTKPALGPDGSPAPFYLIAALAFDDEESMAAALEGPEGQAAVADLDHFAGAGVALMTGPTSTWT